MKYKYVIWDWNGTLFDDVEISVYTMNKMLEKTGYKNRIDLDLYKKIFTFPVSESVSYTHLTLPTILLV